MNPRDIPPEAFHANGAEVQALDFGYVRSPDQDRTTPAQHPIVVIGAGPVGLSLAIDLAQRGRKVIGMPLIWGFKKTSDPNAFEDGKIYNGENGKTYEIYGTKRQVVGRGGKGSELFKRGKAVRAHDRAPARLREDPLPSSLTR